jgi:hypothetical protein
VALSYIPTTDQTDEITQETTWGQTGRSPLSAQSLGARCYWTMWAPMLALRNPDPALNLPHGTVLQPIIFVRNTTAKGIVAELALNWRGDSGTGQVKLPELQLPAFATSQLQIGTMRQLLRIPDSAHWALVELSTTASPDDLIALATSVDATGRYDLATRFTGDGNAGTDGTFTYFHRSSKLGNVPSVPGFSVCPRFFACEKQA